jgi:hypothetical protein
MSSLAPIKSTSGDPCNSELQEFTECVKRHPGGLKETDCEDVKAKFKKCMKEWKERSSTSS